MSVFLIVPQCPLQRIRRVEKTRPAKTRILIFHITRQYSVASRPLRLLQESVNQAGKEWLNSIKLVHKMFGIFVRLREIGQVYSFFIPNQNNIEYHAKTRYGGFCSSCFAMMKFCTNLCCEAVWSCGREVLAY